MKQPPENFLPECFCLQSGKVARLIARRYNASLAELDVTVNDISLLARMTGNERSSITKLADELGFERTTLVRNLHRMEQRKLIARVEQPGRAVSYTATSEGKRILKLALPIWKKNHGELMGRFGSSDGAQIMNALNKMSAILQ